MTENYYCENCGCSWGVNTFMRSTTYIIKTIIGSNEKFDGKCPSCGCADYIVDPSSFDYEDERLYQKTMEKS